MPKLTPILVASIFILCQNEVGPKAVASCSTGLIETHTENMSTTDKIVVCDPPKDKRFKDLTGMTFGRLTVDSFYGRHERKKFWMCQCSCGNKRIVCGSDLNAGDVKSCGCLREEARTKESEIPKPLPETRHIALTQGKYTVIDEKDFDEVSRFKWCFDGLYATRNCEIGGKRTMQRLHLFLMGPADGMEVDHRDLDRLNNRRSNLRCATRGQNGCNRGIHKNNKSGHKGVILCKRTGRWIAGIVVNKSRKHLGTYDSPEEAHAAYVSAAKELHGEFYRAT